VFIILDVKLDESIPEYFSSSPISKIVRGFLINLESEKVNIFEMYRVDHYAEIYFISTGKEYRGIGLAREMTRRGLEIIVSMKYPLVTAVFTNPLSRKIGKHFGFKEIARSQFSEMKSELIKRNLKSPYDESVVDESELFASFTAKLIEINEN